MRSIESAQWPCRGTNRAFTRGSVVSGSVRASTASRVVDWSSACNSGPPMMPRLTSQAGRVLPRLRAHQQFHPRVGRQVSLADQPDGDVRHRGRRGEGQLAAAEIYHPARITGDLDCPGVTALSERNEFRGDRVQALHDARLSGDRAVAERKILGNS